MMRKKVNKNEEIYFDEESQEENQIHSEKGQLLFMDDVKRKQYFQHFCGNVLLKKSETYHDCKKDGFFLIYPGKNGSGSLNWCQYCLAEVKKKIDHFCSEKERISPVLLTTRNQKLIKDLRQEYPIVFQIDKKIRNAYLYTILMKIGTVNDGMFQEFMRIYKNNLVKAKLQKKNIRVQIFNQKRMRKYLGMPQTRHQLIRIAASNMVAARERKKWNFQTVQAFSCEGFDLNDVSPMEILETFPYFCRLGWYINDRSKLEVLIQSKQQNYARLGQYLYEQLDRKREFVMDSEMKFHGFDTDCLVGAFASNLPWGTYDVRQSKSFLERYDVDEFIIEDDIEDMVEIDFKTNYTGEIFGFEKQLEMNSFYTECYRIYAQFRNLIESVQKNRNSQLKKQKQDIRINLIETLQFENILKRNHTRVTKLKQNLKKKFNQFIGDHDILNEAAMLSQAITLKELCFERNYIRNVPALTLLKLPIQTNKKYICSWKEILIRFPNVFKPNNIISKQKFTVRQYEDVQQLNCMIRKKIYQRLNAYSRRKGWKKYVTLEQFQRWYNQNDLALYQKHTIKGSDKIWEVAKILFTDLLRLMEEDGVISPQKDGRLQFNIYKTFIKYKQRPFQSQQIEIKVLKEEFKEYTRSYDIADIQKQDILTSWLQKYTHNLYWFIIGLHVIYPNINWAKKKRKANSKFVSEENERMDAALRQLTGLKQIDNQICYQISDFVFGEQNEIKSLLLDFQKKQQVSIDEKLVLQYQQMRINQKTIQLTQKKIKISEDQFVTKRQYYMVYAKSKIEGKISRNIKLAQDNFIQYFTERWKIEIGYPEVKKYLLKYENNQEFRNRIDNIENDYRVRFYKEWQLNIMQARKKQILDEYAVKTYDEWYFYIGHDLFIMHFDFALQPTLRQKRDYSEWKTYYIEQYFKTERISPHKLLQVEYNIMDKQIPMKNSHYYNSQIKRIQKQQSEKYARLKIMECQNRDLWIDFIQKLPPNLRSFEAVMTLQNCPPLVEKGKQLFKQKMVEIEIVDLQIDQEYLISARKRRQKVEEKLSKKKGFEIIEPLLDIQRINEDYITQQGMIEDDKYRIFDFFISYVRDEIPFYCLPTMKYVLWDTFRNKPDVYKGYQVVHGTQTYYDFQMKQYVNILQYKSVPIDSKLRLAVHYRELLEDKEYCSKLVFYLIAKRMRIIPEKIDLSQWFEVKIDKIVVPRWAKLDTLYFRINGQNYHLFASEMDAVLSINKGQIQLSQGIDLIKKNDQIWLSKKNELEIAILLNGSAMDSQMEEKIHQKMECQKHYDEYEGFEIQKLYQQQNHQQQQRMEEIPLINYQLLELESLLDKQYQFSYFQPIESMQKHQQLFCYPIQEYQIERQYVQVETFQKLVLFEGKMNHKCSICHQNFIFDDQNDNIGYCPQSKCKNNELKIVLGLARQCTSPIFIQKTFEKIDQVIQQPTFSKDRNNIELKIQQFTKKNITQQLIWMGSFPNQLEVYGVVQNTFEDQIRKYFNNYNYLPLKAVNLGNSIVIKAMQDIPKGCILGALGGQIWKQRQLIIYGEDKIIQIGMCGDERVIYCSRQFINHTYYFDGKYDFQWNLSLVWSLYTDQNGKKKLGLFFVSNKKIKKNKILKYRS